MLNRIYSTIILIISTSQVFSQSIVDDSTVANISYSQTKYFTKQDIFVGDTIRRSLYATERFDRFQHNFIDTNLIQDLGMYGSAGFSWYTPYNRNLGQYDGITIYNHLAYQDKDVKYYDTKVPFSNLTFRRNFGGSQYASGLYTQSLGQVANLGCEIKRFTTPTNFGSNPKNTIYAENISTLAHASFITPNKLYKLLVNYRFMNNTISENGGVKFDTLPQNKDSLSTESFVDQNLQNAKGQEKRNEWSVYQEFSPFKNGELKLFHSLDRIKKVNRYEDNNLTLNKEYYQNFYLDNKTTKDSNVYKVIENKLGLSGRLGQVSYATYIKNRYWKYESDTNLWDTASVKIKRKNDLYVGGDLFYQTKARDVNARLNLEIGFDGTRKFDFVSDFKFIKLYYLDLKNLVSLRQQNFNENNFSWNNNFAPYTLREIKLEPYYKGEKFNLSAFYSKQNYSNFVYYDSTLQPVQDSTDSEGQLFGFSGTFAHKKWTFGQFIQVAEVKELKFMAVPKLYSHTNIAYKFKLKKLSSLKMTLGTDINYFSSYKPMSYRSDLQSFVLQNDYTEQNYLNLDLYLIIHYKTVDASLKGINVLQGLAGNQGYYPTYGYIGRKRGVELGLRWNFFR